MADSGQPPILRNIVFETTRSSLHGGPRVCLKTVVLVSGKALAAVFSDISAMYTGG